MSHFKRMDICPIDSVCDLWKWEHRCDVSKEFGEQLVNFEEKSGPEVLISHDMKGGYLPEESNSGQVYENEETYPFIFLNWWNIDIFNYFSHHFVTIPPDSYTKIAHRHGVLSLGTFITEFDDGIKLCEKIFENRQNVQRTVNSLVAISRFYGFDGWLLNIENDIAPTKIDDLIDFVELLTKEMRESNENSRVIWYDAVTHSGKLLWQNCLNSSNCRFYHAGDGIFLNYNWTEEHLEESRELCGPPHKIFVGIDVWARGCVGGYESYKSLQIARNRGMSVAIFAPGWIHEKFPETNQIRMGIGFWEKLYPFVETRKVSIKHFSTDFGCGMFINPEGKRQFKLSNVSLQPQCLGSDCYQIVGRGLIFFGANRRFPIFNFSSIPFKEMRIEIDSDHPIKMLLNGQHELEFSVESGQFIIIGEEILEVLYICTKENVATTIRNFEISLK